ncbi:MAG: DUF4115 domain-containing protein [Candidatus Omnitrophica bacterium]|nr:DUF4115 domain-containing protein [Candidatus Omnitrophota bacterium]MDD5440987.1 DUF4115 domain-containing protein [Candidatus Omnitrophota bacterium]
MIEDICAKFKQKRIDLGYGIEETVEKTKLHPMVIRDIEDGRLTNISSAYLKGFIRIYAQFLKIDPNILLDELKNLEPPKPQKNKLIVNKAREKKEKEKKEREAARKRPSININIVKPLAAIILIIFAAWLIWILIFGFFGFIGKLFTHKKPEPVSVQEQEVVSEPENIEVRAEKIEKKVLQKENSAPITLSVTAKRKCFIKVKIDGSVVYQGILKKGFIETWEAEKKIEMSISDGSSLYLEVNGKNLPALTTMKKAIKNLVITPTGIFVDK